LRRAFQLTLFIFIAFSPLINSADKSINHKYLSQNLNYLYKNLSFQPDLSFVDTLGPKFKGTSGYDPKGNNQRLNINDFLKQVSWSQSVFPARTGSGNGFGTAFFVGGDFVLTNKHVVEPKPGEMSCGHFNIRVKIPFEETINCKKIIYCSDSYDFCLVEMEKLINKDSLSDHLPALRLLNSKNIEKVDGVYMIGNSVNFGVQGSKGNNLYQKTLKTKEFGDIKTLIHHVPSFGGSSGSPLLNEEGNVIGINFAGDVYKWGGFHAQIGNSLHNYGVPSEIILSELQENLTGNLFNQLGYSKKEFIQAKELSEHLKALNKLIFADQSFNQLIKIIREKDTLTGFLKIQKKSSIELTKLLDIKDKSKNKFLEIFAKNINTIQGQFILQIEKIISDHGPVLQDRDDYFRKKSECLQQSKTSTDGCIFTSLFKKYFFLRMKSFPLDESKINRLWEETSKLSEKSINNYFNHSAKEFTQRLIEHAKNTISPKKYFLECLSRINNKFHNFDTHLCKDHTKNILEKYKFLNPSEDLIRGVYLYFLNNFELIDIQVSLQNILFNDQSPCFFNTKTCRRKNYKKRLIKKGENFKNLNDSEIELVLEALLKYHVKK
tara:strand:+ start:2320 stop:4137 length:1818 start_codon:yes stop_codon:yes gene_type:complete